MLVTPPTTACERIAARYCQIRQKFSPNFFLPTSNYLCLKKLNCLWKKINIHRLVEQMLRVSEPKDLFDLLQRLLSPKISERWPWSQRPLLRSMQAEQWIKTDSIRDGQPVSNNMAYANKRTH